MMRVAFRNRILAVYVASVAAAFASDDYPVNPPGSISQPLASGTTASVAPQFQPVSGVGAVDAGPVPRLAGTSQLGGSRPVSDEALFTAGEGLLQWGAAHLYPHFLYQLSYGNGLQPLPGEQVNTMINQISPGVLVGLGQHWTVDYTPTLVFYSDRRFQDAVNQAASLRGSTSYGAWTLGLSQGYSHTFTPLIETSAQTPQDLYSTGLTAGYQVNSKVSLDLGVNQNFRFIGQTVQSEFYSDMLEWSTMDWVNYAVFPRLSFGLGAGFTYDHMIVGSDIATELYQGRIAWGVGDKLSLVLSGGLSDAQFLASGNPSFLTPVFSLSAQYQLFDSTRLVVAGSRSITPSYFANQLTETTLINGGVHQRLLGRLYFDAMGGYGTTSYRGTSSVAANSSLVSDYNTISFSAALSTTLFKRANASIFYQATHNTSVSSVYNYDTHEVGLTLGYNF